MNLDSDFIKRSVPIERIIGQYVELKPSTAGELVALCPFHREDTPSFTVTPHKRIFYCFGCQVGGDAFTFLTRHEGISFSDAVRRVAEVGGVDSTTLARSSQPEPPSARQPSIVATYPYVDEQGELLMEVLRFEPGRNGRRKDFSQRRIHPADGSWVNAISAGRYRKGTNGEWYLAKGAPCDTDDDLPEARRVLYRLPEVLGADVVYLVEGEKDVATIEAAGLVGTTASGGAAAKWLPEYTQALTGKRVVVIPDRDSPGAKRALAVMSALKQAGIDAVRLDLPELEGVKDVTDFVESGHSILDLIAEVENARIAQIRDEIEKRGLLSPAEILDFVDGGVVAFLDPSKRAKGIETGFRGIDDMTLGLHAGELTVLAARPAMGKTSLALNIAANAARKGHPVAIFSLEMSRESLLSRLVCSEARIDAMRYRSGFLGREDRIRLQRCMSKVCDLPIRIDDQPITDIEKMYKKLAVMVKSVGLRLVVVDYLQLMGGIKTAQNRTQEVSGLSRGLKIMARELKVPVIALSQLSRGPEQRPGDHRPQLSDLRESGSIEQDADVVEFIFREEVYKPDRPDLKGVAEVIIAKQRNGPTGKIQLAFLHALTRFENAAIDQDSSEAAA